MALRVNGFYRGNSTRCLEIRIEIHLKFAMWAGQNKRPKLPLRLLEQGFLTLFETMATKFMRALKIIHALIVYVSKSAPGNLPAFILLFLGTPVFKAHAFCFHLASFCLYRKIILLNRHSLLLGIDDCALQFHDLRVHLDIIADA